jgi:L-rhamnose mutarotase
MKRYGMTIGLKKGKLQEYKAYHDEVWPEILQMIESCNIKNYSIFYRNNQLFSYFEYHGDSFEMDMQKMADDEKTKEWWAIMGPLQEPEPDRNEGEWWANMEEVFHKE